MESLLSSYASSDDEQDSPPHRPPPPQRPPLQPPPSSSKPTSSSFLSSLPKPTFSKTPKSHQHSSIPNSSPSSSLFTVLPPPKSQTTIDSPLPTSNPKRVVQFRPPQLPISDKVSSFDKDDDDDEVDEIEKERKRKRQLGHNTSVKSFLAAIPAPKNPGTSSLGASGGRRSIIEASVPAPVAAPVSDEVVGSVVGTSDVSGSGDGSHEYNYEMDYGNYTNVEAYAGGSGSGSGGGEYGGYESYEPQQSYDGNSNWNFDSGSNSVSVGGTESLSGGAAAESFMGMGGGKRRKNQLPAEIVEVKQDELMKNRPTPDKSKLTGLAFGPSYQPASSKGKPSKLHKRKHQISALYFDMKNREPEFAERRAKGFLTKAETQAKYGW